MWCWRASMGASGFLPSVEMTMGVSAEATILIAYHTRFHGRMTDTKLGA